MYMCNNNNNLAIIAFFEVGLNNIPVSIDYLDE